MKPIPLVAVVCSLLSAFYTVPCAAQPCLTVVCPTNKTEQCGSAWTFDAPSATTCCPAFIILSSGVATNVSITSTAIVTNGVCPKYYHRDLADHRRLRRQRHLQPDGDGGMLLELPAGCLSQQQDRRVRIGVELRHADSHHLLPQQHRHGDGGGDQLAHQLHRHCDQRRLPAVCH